ncbi:hypothetical protein M3P21_16325 [Ruegeria sp. 2012CJ41-6]|uniref:Uncharacterized protein n=1 Tax=Ruegeria spongiae TaxID=2942209 RepID=A0ABT0Q5M1_9RHOB|nr:hypothetical protein [Ruegeria spongiae]MCL6285097.1 hypothetical protein [Ruegeria spongiae]
MPEPAATLSRSLDHVASLLDRARPGFPAAVAMGLGGDPLFIDLPEYRGGLGGQISAEALQVVAALYFSAEIEGTYLMSVAEELAANRFTLNLTDREAAERLERLADAMQQGWVGRDLRNQIFARVFGVGYADPNLGDTAVNREFEPQLARFCVALLRAAQSLGGYSSSTGTAMRAGVAAQSLLASLSGRMQGNTLIVAERLSQQLRVALNALNHRGLATLFRGANAWDVVRNVLGPDTPDLAGHITRAQTGLRLIGWMADHLPSLRSADSRAISAAISSEPQAAGWAELWLTAAGIDLASQPTHQSAPGWLQ